MFLQKCHMRGLPPTVGWPVCVGHVRVVVGRAGEFIFPFLKELEIALYFNFGAEL